MNPVAALRVVATTPVIRTTSICLLWYGVTLAATVPYQSLIGIKEMGLSNSGFAVFMFAVAVVSVAAGVGLGILTDLVANRKRLVLILAACGAVGYGAVWLLPHPLVFLVMMLTLIPVSRALFSVLFGGMRRDMDGMAAADITQVNSTVRAIYALSWILVPGLAAWALSGQTSLLPVFLVASLSTLALLLTYAIYAPASDPAGAPRPAGSFRAALSLLGSTAILTRVLIVALGQGAHALHSALHPLVMIDVAGGTTRDVGLYAGLLAGLEIPFMLIWAEVARRRSLGVALALALLVYAVYCGLMGFVTAPWQLYAIAVLNACGAAAVLSLPMTYFQDLFPDRPGLGTSLQPAMNFIGGLFAAAGFALGTAVSGYSGTAFIAGGLCVAGAIGLAVIERTGRRGSV